MAAILLIKDGEDLEFSFDLDGMSIQGWVCTMLVRASVEGPVLIGPRIIPPVGRRWPGTLTSTDTDPLDIGIHLLIGELVNSAEGQKREINKRFFVQRSIDTFALSDFIIVTGTSDFMVVTGTSEKIAVTPV